MSESYGFEDGSRCGRMGCAGKIEIHPSDNCSCHISPPCSSCTSPRAFCPECDWQEKDDECFNDYIVNVNHATGTYRTWTLRPLDKTKIDWHSFSHSNSSMIKRGVYPEGTSRSEVLKVVNGTFGGVFKHFGGGTFEFIAYTD